MAVNARPAFTPRLHFMTILRWLGVALAALVVLWGLLSVAGHLRWASATNALQARLADAAAAPAGASDAPADRSASGTPGTPGATSSSSNPTAPAATAQRPAQAASSAGKPARFDATELNDLPPPVQRYFRAVLTEGQPLVRTAHIEHQGRFDMGEAAADWKPFRSRQQVTTARPGFLWDARIAVMPGAHVRVHDAYIGGEGLLHASLIGLVTVADLRGTPQMAEGELIRWFAEAAWYPTALLPSQGVRWEPLDERSARATLTDGKTRVTLTFLFAEDGTMQGVRAEARGRTVGGQIVATPWEGRWSNTQLRHGMRVPLSGEVAWLTPQGRKPYWQGTITALDYEFSR
jgi:hypothetical protein